MVGAHPRLARTALRSARDPARGPSSVPHAPAFLRLRSRGCVPTCASAPRRRRVALDGPCAIAEAAGAARRPRCRATTNHEVRRAMTGAPDFSPLARSYAAFRPAHPGELFAWLASVVLRRDLAWDTATGNGQAALGLAEHFERVVATDNRRRRNRSRTTQGSAVLGGRANYKRRFRGFGAAVLHARGGPVAERDLTRVGRIRRLLSRGRPAGRACTGRHR